MVFVDFEMIIAEARVVLDSQGASGCSRGPQYAVLARDVVGNACWPSPAAFRAVGNAPCMGSGFARPLAPFRALRLAGKAMARGQVFTST